MKDIKIKKLQPQFTTVLTTLNVYEEDLIVDGVVFAPKGTLRIYQTVLAVGPNVHNIKEGDMVLLNFTNYRVRKYKENDIKNGIESMEEEIVFDIPKLLIDGKLVGKFQDRDVEGVITDFDEFETEKPKETLI